MKWSIFIMLCSCLLFSCAGPHSPFGAINNPQEIKSHIPLMDNTKNVSARSIASTDDIKIKVYPPRILFHRSETLNITLESEAMQKLNLKQFKVYYNGIDVTQSFLDRSTISENYLKDKILIKTPGQRFLPDRDSHIVFQYKDSIHEYKKPECNIFNKQDVLSYDQFSHKEKIIKNIVGQLKRSSVNPNFMLGLVAQESAFDPKAISWAKAIGLTQITNSAATHVTHNYPKWKQYNDIDKLSTIQLKAMIMAGVINKNNEWRLNQDKSVQGAVDYIKYLYQYWDREYNYQQLVSTFGSENSIPMTDIILASYNSGAYRVRKNLKHNEKNWLKSSELKEARKYVGRIKSYCYTFANQI